MRIEGGWSSTSDQMHPEFEEREPLRKRPPRQRARNPYVVAAPLVTALDFTSMSPRHFLEAVADLVHGGRLQQVDADPLIELAIGDDHLAEHWDQPADFISRGNDRLELARRSGNPLDVAFWQSGIEVLRRFHGAITHIDARA